MGIDLNILIELSKMTSQIDENSVLIEQKLIHNNNRDIKNTSNGNSYTVQLGDSRLILFNKKNSKHSQEERQKFFEQLMGLDSSTSELRAGFQPAPFNMDTLGRRLSQEYKEYQQVYNEPPLSKRFDTRNYDPVRFQVLSQDPHAKRKVYHKKTVDETRSAIQSEIEGIIKDVQRIPKPYCNLIDLDFAISGPFPYTHLDFKHPVGSAILKKQNQTSTLRQASYKLGVTISEQKERFCGLEQGPKSRKNVLHIVDLCYVPAHEKEIVKELCLKGAGSSEGILFLNT